MEVAKLSAGEIQQKFYESLGDRDWNEYDEYQHNILKQNIGFALFGVPQNLEQSYDAEKTRKIENIHKLILDNHYIEDVRKIQIRIIFVVGEKNPDIGNDSNDVDPIIRPLFITKKCEQSKNRPCIVVIDDEERVYSTWDDYKNNNTFPPCIMYCPLDGNYSGEIAGEEVFVRLEIILSPASTKSQSFLRRADTTGSMVSVATAVAMGASLIPGVIMSPAILTAATVSAGVAGVYSVGRSVGRLVDRRQHSQSVSPRDKEARASWLTVAAAGIGVATTAASTGISWMAGSGRIVSNSTIYAYNALAGLNVLGCFANITNSGYSFYERLSRNERPDPLEILQFTTSILFFYNSVASFKTARAIISETQSKTLQSYQEKLNSDKQRKLFRKAQLEAQRVNGELLGNAELISGIRNIGDPDNFFSGLASINKDLNETDARYTITADGKIKINNARIVDPQEFAGVSRANRLQLLNDLPAPQSSITVANFNRRYQQIVRCFDVIANNSKIGPRILEVVQSVVSNNMNLDTITLLLKDYAENIVRSFIRVFVEFLDNLPCELQMIFQRIYPGVLLPVGMFQFMLQMINQLAKEIGIPLEQYLHTLFDHNGKVSEDFLLSLLENFKQWMSNILEATGQQEVLLPIRSKKLQKCSKCNGCYYKSVY